jgi:hypothetical protein
LSDGSANPVPQSAPEPEPDPTPSPGPKDTKDKEKDNAKANAKAKEKGESKKGNFTEKSTRLLPNGWIETYLEYCRNQESPHIYHQWVAFSMIAATLKRSVWIEHGRFKVYPNLYTVLVGPTGIRKSTAIDEGGKVLREIDGMKILAERMSPEGIIDQMMTDNQKVRMDLKGNSYFYTESDVYILAQELSSFLGKQNYMAGIVELLTSHYQPTSIPPSFTTKGGGKQIAENHIINFLGASNAEWLAKSFNDEDFGGGFAGRVLFIVEDKFKKVAWPDYLRGQKELKELLIADLGTISRLHGPIVFTKEAKQLWIKWYDSFEPDYSAKLSGYYKRKGAYVMKIAGILSVSYTNNLLIEEFHVMAAIKLLDQIEGRMLDAFTFVGMTPQARTGQYILDIIRNYGGMITQKSLIRETQHMLRSLDEFRSILQTLLKGGLITIGKVKKEFVYSLSKEYVNLIKKKREQINKTRKDIWD